MILTKTTEGTKAALKMECGDQVSIVFTDKAGELQVVNVSVKGAVMLVEHEQTQDALVVRRGRTQFVKG